MNRFYSTILFVLLVHSAQLFTSCTVCDGDYSEIYYDIFRFKSDFHQSSGPLNREKIRITIEPDSTSYEYYPYVQVGGFLSSAYACSPAPPALIPNHHIVDLQVRTLYGFQDELAAGDDITDYFYVSGLILYTEISDYLSSGRKIGITLVNHKAIPGDRIQLEIIITMSNGKIFTSTTSDQELL